MSKSLGNVVAPEEIIKNNGAEIIRVWVASADYTEDPRIGPEIIDSAIDSYRKVRNTLRYLLGALSGFTESERVRVEEMPELERYMLHLLARRDDEIRAAFDAFDFKRVWRSALDFCSLDLSAFYLDIRKDSLYCDPAGAVRRRAARSVMDAAFERLVRWLAPIAAFTTEEAYLSRHPSDASSVHLQTFEPVPAGWRNGPLAEKWERIRDVRRVVNGALEIERREKRIGSSLEAAPVIHIADAALLNLCASVDFAELAITSDAIIRPGEGPVSAFRLADVAGVAVEPALASASRCGRCWRHVDDVGGNDQHPELCGRCAHAVLASGAA